MTNGQDVSLGDIQKVLSATAGTLRSLVAGAPDSALDFREASGAWTPLQVLCHVTDGEVTDWMPRLDLILSSGEARTFTPFDREAGFTVYAGWSAEQVLGEFDRLRTANLARLVALDLQDSDLQRTGVHPALGIVTAAQLLACWATHDLAHTAQISRSLVRFFGAHVGPWRQYFSLLADR
jgi:DinB family protein